MAAATQEKTDESEVAETVVVGQEPEDRVLGILTGGGPAQGHNAVIYGVAKEALDAGWKVVGIQKGWKGVLKRQSREITADEIRRLHYWKGGTILGTSRTNLAKMPIPGSVGTENKCPEAAQNLKEMGIYALMALGGEDTISVAEILYRKHDVRVICAPKTIDNDVEGTARTYGWDSACNRIAEEIRGLHEDFQATGYVCVFQAMGRNTGWLTLYGGLAGGAHVILIPEVPASIAKVCEKVKLIHGELGYCFVIVAEDLRYEELSGHIQEASEQDTFKHAVIAARTKGWGQVIAEEIKERTGLSARAQNIGYKARGGDASALDTTMCLQLGQQAFGLIRRGIFGKLVAWHNEAPCVVDLAKAGGGKVRKVPPELYHRLTRLLPFNPA